MSIEISETPSANTVLCGNCGAPNGAARNFCGKCGQGLWEICAACNQRTSAGEAFCGSCGSKLEDSLAKKSSEIEQSLIEAERLAMEFMFQEALAEIEPVLRVAHPRLQTLVERARAQRDRLNREYAERRHEATAAFAAAQSHWEGNDFRRAMQALKSVPESLRGEELQELLATLRVREEECRVMLQQIRARLDKKETDALLPLVEDYLQQDPHHAEVAKLAEKLRQREQQRSLQQRDKLCEAARASLEKFEYQKAVDQLRMIPPEARQGIFFKLLDHAEELAFLANSLREAPHVDRVLVSMAERLAKHSPGDANAAKKLRELRQRIDTNVRDPRGGAPEWAPAPPHPAFGMPVDWWGGFVRLQPKDVKVREQLAAAPGRYFVAAGLALQALQRARVDINLNMPEKKSGLLGQLGKSHRSKPPGEAWGIDLGATALKAIRLSPGEAGRTQIDACEIIEYEKELCRPDAQGQEKEIVGAAIARFLRLHPLDGKAARVAINLPGGRVLGRFLQLPRVKPAKVAELMQYEAGHQIPVPLETLCWGYQVLEADAADADSPMIACVLLAAQQTDVETRVGWCRAAGLNVDIVQSDCAALYNAACAELFDRDAPALGQQPEAEVVLLDLGGDATQILVAGPHSLWFRSVGRGTDEFTRRLIRAFNLTYDKAEPLKRNPAMARQLSKVHEALSPAWNELENELRLTLSSYQAHLGDQDEDSAQGPVKLFGCGGGFLTHGLLRFFRHGR